MHRRISNSVQNSLSAGSGVGSIWVSVAPVYAGGYEGPRSRPAVKNCTVGGCSTLPLYHSYDMYLYLYSIKPISSRPVQLAENSLQHYWDHGSRCLWQVTNPILLLSVRRSSNSHSHTCSCYAFATAAAATDRVCPVAPTAAVYSPQEVLDCIKYLYGSSYPKTYPCSGGWNCEFHVLEWSINCQLQCPGWWYRGSVTA